MKLNIPNNIILYLGLVALAISGFFFTVFVSHPKGFYAFIVVAALVGLGVTTNIWCSKRNKGQLVCPTGSNCNAVVNSRFSKFFGISLEYLGTAYFVFIILSYLTLIFFPGFFTGFKLVSLVGITVGAALFSCYLLFIQAFILGQWCIWCILSASMSLLIFATSLISVPIATNFLSEIAHIILMVKFLGFSLGLGSVTSLVFVFIKKFLKDNKVDEKESDILHGFFELIWLGLGLALVSDFISFVIDPSLSQSGSFTIRVISLMVIAFVGAIFMIIFCPFLQFIPFEREESKKSPFTKLRRPILLLGSIMITSWYFAFITNFVIKDDMVILLTSYTMFILAALAIGLFFEKSLDKKNKELPPVPEIRI